MYRWLKQLFARRLIYQVINGDGGGFAYGQFTTPAEAYAARRAATDYVVAVENNVMRSLTADEERTQKENNSWL